MEEKKEVNPIPKLFARETSGLVREISWLSAMFISMGFIAFYALPVSFLSGMAVSPTGLPVLAALLSWVVLLPHGFLWTRITQSYPRTASGYVFTSRNLHPAIGVGVGLVFGISQMIFDSAIVYFGVSQLQVSFSALAVKYGGIYQVLASALSSPLDILFVGVVTFSIVIALNIFAVKFTNQIMGAISILALTSFILTFLVLGLSNAGPSTVLQASGMTQSQVITASQDALTQAQSSPFFQ